MTAPDWFGVGVRLLGLWCGLLGVQQVLYFLDLRLGFAELRGPSYPDPTIINSLSYLLYAAGYGVLALVLLLGADVLVRWSYGPEAPEEPPDEEPPESQQDPP